MNISIGGPHILLFERDQQLAGLLMSEFQLAGYECHTARTAVEVFDAIARQPIRLVLVNLAQAAAARREFWVALDTQRKGRGVQVLTFRGMNIAGYGPQDPEERSHGAMADIEIDGMAGVMNLIDTVRARIPSVSTASSTMPRMPRSITPPPPAYSQGGMQRPLQSVQGTQASQGPLATQGIFYASGTTSRSAPLAENIPASPRPGSMVYTQHPVNGQSPSSMDGQPPPAGTLQTNQPAYTDKIRAVLYPNQRVWTPPGGNTIQVTQENRTTYDAQNTIVSPPPEQAVPVESSTMMLQRLANGQVYGPGESGLAQLSRMVQERQAPSTDNLYTNTISYQTPEMTRTEGTTLTAPGTTTGQFSPTAGATNYGAPASGPSQLDEKISTQPLRASPIQDIPVERSAAGQASGEGSRRPDVLSRTYGQAPSAPTAIPPLASIATPTMPPSTSAVAKAGMAAQVEGEAYSTEPLGERGRPGGSEEQGSGEKEQALHGFKGQGYEEQQVVLEQPGETDSPMSPNNAMLLDIVQSLPPMPPPGQALQPQILSGRATRSLGSVLLEGHLVPQSRLEVAQNIQRMLRGVDLNYQLGEILLMFKLLTPDQLLAASLVSYGLITTTQISALGRIRQELHSIGLEYDLENLLILFRILTPEQLREVRSSWQS